MSLDVVPRTNIGIGGTQVAVHKASGETGGAVIDIYIGPRRITCQLYLNRSCPALASVTDGIARVIRSVVGGVLKLSALIEKAESMGLHLALPLRAEA